ncbi:MAG: hypothetical protein NTV40_03270 [Solirubrobacterales bacterium]|nr:hypothetical protein [Solirubrobacterales bacterium]
MLRHLRQFPVALALIGAVAAIASSGCGASEDPTKLIDQTFGSKAPIKSGKLGILIAVDSKGTAGINGPLKIKLAGPFEGQGENKLPKFDFKITLGMSGQSIGVGLLSTGDGAFVSFGGQSYELSPKTFASFEKGFAQSQAQADKTKSNQILATLGIDPRDWLKDATVKGNKTIGDTETIQVNAAIDIPKLLNSLTTVLGKASSVTGAIKQIPQSLSAEELSALQKAITSATFDVYTGKDDKILRRLVIEIEVKDSKGRVGALDVTVDLSEVNVPQTIKAPANAKPFSDLSGVLKTIGLGGLTGALEGSGG